MALAIAMLGWLLASGLLAMLEPASRAAGALPHVRATGVFHHFIIPFVAAGLCQSSITTLAFRARMGRAAWVWITWSLISFAAALLPPRLASEPLWSLTELALQQGGLALGLALGSMIRPSLTSRLDRMQHALEEITRALVAAATVFIIVLPLSANGRVFDPANAWAFTSFTGYLISVPGQIYLGLKSLILWVPVGMLYALVRKEAQIQRWALAAVLAFLLVGLPLLHPSLRVQDVLEVMSGYWGVAIGAWVGTEIRRTLPVQGAADAAGTAGTFKNDESVISGALGTASATRLGWRLAAILLLLGVGAWSAVFPRWGPLLAGGFAIYALLLWRYRHAWLLVVPAMLPLLNLAPGTGRFFLDEFDLLLLVTVASALWHGSIAAARPTLHRSLGLPLSLFGCSVVISMVIGLLPLSPLDADAFSNYWSHYNSMRVAKGFVWALALLALVLRTLPIDGGFVMRLFVPGMCLGLAGVIVAGLWERALFAGLFDLRVAYRITATFSSMHTGGSEIETYLVTAIPFVWLAFARERPPLVWLGGGAILLLGAYLMVLTIARAGVLALGVALCILIAGAWRAQHRNRNLVAAVASLALMGVGAALVWGISAGYFHKRLAHSEEDLAVRVGHWRQALAMRDRDALTSAFGMGLGRFPEAYLYRSGQRPLPGTYSFPEDSGNPFLRLGGGETLYMAQRVAVAEDHRYTLTLRARTHDANARLGVPLCEKHLLNSARCQWHAMALQADGEWHGQSVTIDSDKVGAGNWFTRRPVELSLFNDTEATRIDIDDVQLVDDGGKPLIHNGDFTAGMDYWFFKTHSHLPWHIKNLFVEILFEQGWLGLVSFVLLLAMLVRHLARGLWHGDPLASVLLASIGGFVTVGLFGSLFDSARIATLFFMLVGLAGTAVPAPMKRAASRREHAIAQSPSHLTQSAA